MPSAGKRIALCSFVLRLGESGTHNALYSISGANCPRLGSARRVRVVTCGDWLRRTSGGGGGEEGRVTFEALKGGGELARAATGRGEDGRGVICRCATLGVDRRREGRVLPDLESPTVLSYRTGVWREPPRTVAAVPPRAMGRVRLPLSLPFIFVFMKFGSTVMGPGGFGEGTPPPVLKPSPCHIGTVPEMAIADVDCCLPRAESNGLAPEVPAILGVEDILGVEGILLSTYLVITGCDPICSIWAMTG